MILAVLLACIPTMDELASPNPRVQERALRALPGWRAAQVVPQIERAIVPGARVWVVRAALDALVRADTTEAEAVLRSQLDGVWRDTTTDVLGLRHTKRACDLMAELYVGGSVGDERRWLEAHLTSWTLDEGWPCFQSLAPYRADPRIDALWESAARGMNGAPPEMRFR